MAIRIRKGCSERPWEVYWNNPFTGKRERRSFSSEDEAKKFNSLVKHQLKYEKELFQPSSPEDQETPGTITTLQAVYMQYLKYKAFSKKDLRWQLYCMKPILKKLQHTDINAIGREEILPLLNADLQSHVKPATVRNRFSVFRAVLRWAAEQGFRGPVDFPRLPAANYEKFVPPTPEELAAISAVAAPHIQRIIVLGSQCGVRIGASELLQLTWKDVDMQRGVLLIHGSKKNKNALWREVPIREQLLPVFEQWRKDDEVLGATHIVHFRGKPITAFGPAWRRTLQRAGITRRIRPYDLRHAFATEAIAAGIDVGTVASLMGHSSPTMIFNHYQFVMTSQKRSAVEALPQIPKCVMEMCHKKSTYENAS